MERLQNNNNEREKIPTGEIKTKRNTQLISCLSEIPPVEAQTSFCAGTQIKRWHRGGVHVQSLFSLPTAFLVINYGEKTNRQEEEDVKGENERPLFSRTLTPLAEDNAGQAAVYDQRWRRYTLWVHLQRVYF